MLNSVSLSVSLTWVLLYPECRGKNPFLAEPLDHEEVGVLTLADHSRLRVRSQPVEPWGSGLTAITAR